MMTKPPPPPPGFVMIDAPAQSAIPPPPPGFAMIDDGAEQDAPPQSFADKLRGFGNRVDAAIAGNATEEIPSIMSPEFEAYTGRTSLEQLGAATSGVLPAIFGKDSDMAANALQVAPGSRLDQDSNGNPVVVTRDGRRFYVNEPGLDRDDVLRTGGNIASYLPAGRLAAGFRGLAPRAGMMAAGSGATNLAGQAAGREEVDLGEAGLVTALGGAGELAFPIAGKLYAGLRRTLGREPSSVEVALELTKHGIDPASLKNAPPMVMRDMAEEARAGANPAALAGEAEFGFRYTRGQKTGDHGQLSREELLRQGQGPGADQLRGVAAQNQQVLADNVTDITKRLAGGRAPSSPVEAFERTQGVVQRQADELSGRVDAAYLKAREGMAGRVSPTSVQALPGRLKKALGDFAVDPRLTPATSSVLDRINGRIAVMNRPGAQNAMARDLASIETERRVVNSAIEGAANPTDRAALVKVKRELDNWIDDSYAEVLSTDKLIPLKEARELRAQFGARFEGRGTDAAMDNFIEQLVKGGKSADELVNIAFGMTQVSKPAAARFVRRVKLAIGDNKEAMDGLRAAHFLKLTTSKAGEPLGMQAIRNNILGTERNAPATIRELYTDNEWRQLKRLASSLEPMIPKGDFARSSGSAERIARMLTTMRAAPGVRVVVDRWQELIRARQAQDAVSRMRLPSQRQVLLPAAAASTGTSR